MEDAAGAAHSAVKHERARTAVAGTGRRVDEKNKARSDPVIEVGRHRLTTRPRRLRTRAADCTNPRQSQIRQSSNSRVLSECSRCCDMSMLRKSHIAIAKSPEPLDFVAAVPGRHCDPGGSDASVGQPSLNRRFRQSWVASARRYTNCSPYPVTSGDSGVAVVRQARTDQS
jgi:hypothetical protein